MIHNTINENVEAVQEQNNRMSRSGFLKLAAAGALGAAGLALSMPQSTMAAKYPPIDEGRDWRIPEVQPGFYVIQSQLNGYVLDIRGGNTAAGAQIIAYPLNMPLTPNQVWYVSADGYIVSALNGYVLDVSGANTAPATPVISYPRNTPSSTNQHWRFARGYIISTLDNDVLDIYGGNTAPGTAIIAYPRNTPQTKNQLWNLRPLTLAFVR